MTREELFEKFERLNEENKITAILYLEQLIAHQDTHPVSQDSAGSGEQPEI